MTHSQIEFPTYSTQRLHMESCVSIRVRHLLQIYQSQLHSEPTGVTALLHHPVLCFLWLTTSADFLCGPMLTFLFCVKVQSPLWPLPPDLRPFLAPTPHTQAKPTLISCNYTLLEKLSLWPRWEANKNETYLRVFFSFARNEWKSFSCQAYDDS